MRKAFVVVGTLLAAIAALWLFVTVTAMTRHPDLKDVPTVAGSAPSPKSAGAVAKARHIVLEHLTEKNLPGLSVAVGIDGDIQWAEGFGFADLKNGVPVTPEHPFRLGTASTLLTSAAAALLLKEGRLNPDDEIQKYVPAFPRKPWPVTLREVLGDTAGFGPQGGDEGSLFTKHCERTVDALPYFAERPLLFKPGTQYRDSNYGWILASAAIETAANQPFLTFMREHVFDPLGMRDTIPDPSTVEGDDDFPLANLIREVIFDPRARRASAPDTATKPRRAQVTSYFPRFAKDPKYGLHLMRPLDYSCYSAAGVFLSTPSDLVRFGMAIERGKLPRPPAVERLPRVALSGKQTPVIGGNGDLLGGTVASLITFPGHGIVVAVTSNISYADTFPLAVKIAEAFAGEVLSSTP